MSEPIVEIVAKIAWGAFMEDALTETEWPDADPEVNAIWREAASRIVAEVRDAQP
jgi:hypothetical protein